MTKPSVLFVSHSLRMGGTEKLVVSLINNIDRELMDVSLLTIGTDNPLAHEISSMPVCLVEATRHIRGDFVTPSLRLRELLQTRRFDAIVCFGLWEFVFVRLGSDLSVPKVISLHFSTPSNTASYLKTYLEARLLSGHEKLVSVSDAQADYLSRTYDIPRHRFTTIHNGVDTSHFDPIAAESRIIETRRACDLPEGARAIAMVASLSPNKGHEFALDAMQILGQRRPDLAAYLLAVGDGSDERRRRLEMCALDRGVLDRVRFTGLQADPRPFLALSKCFSLASTSVEALSIAALEALSMGLPLVLTSVGGAAEIVKPGVNGYLVTPANAYALAAAWERVLEQPFDRNAIRNEAIARFDIRRCADSYQGLILGSL